MKRIAFVGGGPKVLFALLELHDACSVRAVGALCIDVYDPYPPGAGRVWQTGQPEQVRLNVAASIVDAAHCDDPESFGDWVQRVAPQHARELYPPRAVVGEYLHDRFVKLRQTASFPIRHVTANVTAVLRRQCKWEVISETGSEFYDEVVLATGHGLPDGPRTDNLSGALNPDALIGDYRVLGEESILPTSRVLIRGAALTAYDAVLLLTEGRGGRWEQHTVGPWLSYCASGREPARISMGSRSNVPMDSKPERVPENILRTLDPYRERILVWGMDVRTLQAAGQQSTPREGDMRGVESGASYAGLFRVLLSCAMECATVLGIRISALELWRTALTGREEATPALQSVAEQIRRGIRINRGMDVPDARWIWGRVWSGLYPQITRAVSRVRWDPIQTRRFNKVASNLEKMAFGPPEQTALKLLALLDAGLLEQVPFKQQLDSETVLIDAVTPRPGVLEEPGGQAISPLFASLLDAGEITVRPGETGLLTDAQGSCMDARGKPSTTLTALGRPTEGPTLGHDTLNRMLHPEPHGWAQRIARQLSPQYSGELT
ncbi:hypothetical protein CQ018_11315 [Arthrobacter sp. MYb227]|uniref:FAD/NAD(P)-binding protein n=1 Tax=Arthrobacter sp. MYb227 TaxID=1848601 RepID=UPI000CFB99A3|nr:FAD/NAD(P)-binding protein [Arthrobacter sp. MYb227]PQZ93033.1 hypothetical protein CQ018_11315 [Arthrobacter sp. MYb227]